MVVKGNPAKASGLAPKPKSMLIAPSVAVVCGDSSKTLSMEGSKLVNELHSSGLLYLDGESDEAGEPKTVAVREEEAIEGEKMEESTKDPFIWV
jgi:hypothetical protein